MSANNSKRRIAVVTGTRAEYGLLHWTMRELKEKHADTVDMRLIVTGTHLSPEFGMTVDKITADGFEVAENVDMLISSDREVSAAISMGVGLMGIAGALDRIKPDIVLLLGDRFEILAAGCAATVLRLPIAHIHGGEITEGAVDESIRHALSKLSYWHFAIAESYARRLVQMGERPEHVFHVGAPGVDNLSRLPLLSREALAAHLGLDFSKPVLLVTYHPETLHQGGDHGLEALMRALKEFPDTALIVTGANADAGGRQINKAWQRFLEGRQNAHFAMSLGSLHYLSCMKQADIVLGNSSSGVIEAPAAGAATVNIGDRQKGRLRCPTVVDCKAEAGDIARAITHALSPEFRQNVKPQSLFGTPGQVGPRVAELLATLPIPSAPRKPFHDLPPEVIK